MEETKKKHLLRSRYLSAIIGTQTSSAVKNDAEIKSKIDAK